MSTVSRLTAQNEWFDRQWRGWRCHYSADGTIYWFWSDVSWLGLDMLEWISGAKILLSKHVLGSVRDVYKYLTSVPEWKKDIAEVKATIKRRDREHAKAFGHALRLKMQSGFGSGDIEAFLLAYYELVDNAFRHGCETDSDSVTVRAVLFGAGVSAEVINNNKSKKIPSLDQFKDATARGMTGRGLPQVLSIVHQADLTTAGRGIKVVLYRRATSHHLAEEGITFVNLGGFSSDAVEKINRTLDGRQGDVIIVFSPEVVASSLWRAAAEVAKKEFVGRFAIVAEKENLILLSRLVAEVPKLVGFFDAPEKAIAALRPRPGNDLTETTATTKLTKRSRKRDPSK